jgi:hypothetical protein
MKMNITHGQVTKVSLGGPLALVLIGLLCWPALSRRSRVVITPPPTRGLVVARSSTSLLLGPNKNQVTFLPSGPVSGAADATARAVLAANSAARRDYSIEPFTDLKPTASFDGRFWSWRKRVACGHGDFEAEVKIAPDGTIERINVEFLTQQLAAK